LPYNPHTEVHVEKSICVEYEDAVISGVKKFLSIQKKLGVAPPICVMMSFLETKGCGVTKRTLGNHTDLVLDSFPFKEERLLLPEMIFESFEADVSKGMKPIFDIVLNTAGISRADIEE